MILFGFVFLNMLNKPILQCITTTPTILIPQPLPKPYAASDSEPPPRPLLKFGALAGSGTQEAAYSFRVYMIAGGGLARRDSRGNEGLIRMTDPLSYSCCNAPPTPYARYEGPV